MDTIETLKGMLPFIIPLFILEVVLIVIALLDLTKREHVRGGSKIVWALVIILINVIGPIVYLLAGRKENNGNGD